MLIDLLRTLLALMACVALMLAIPYSISFDTLLKASTLRLTGTLLPLGFVVGAVAHGVAEFLTDLLGR